MLKYLAKVSMDIFPSVLATIIGAYIVNHYINARPATDTPAAAVAPAETSKNGKPAGVANLPAPGVKAKGVSEKNVAEKAAVEKPADKSADQPAEAKASDAKASDTKGSDTKSADVTPAEATSHGRPSTREKAVAKSTPATSPAVAPTVEANSAPAAGPTAATPDANDLVRAAVERLRKSPEAKSAEAKSSETKSSDAKSSETKSSEAKAAEKTSQPAVQETARATDAGPRVQDAPRSVTEAPSALRPLPPPITVSAPPSEAYGNGAQANPPYTASIGNDDPNRMTPPADIPVPVIAPPLDLRADAGAPVPQRPKTNVADDMLSGMKSMFHAVLPKGATPD